MLCTYTIKYKPCFPQYPCPPSSFPFSKGQNLSERQHLCFATGECVVHPFHFPVPLHDPEPANSLCYRFHSIYFCWVFKTSRTENHLLTNYFSFTLLDNRGGFSFVASSQLHRKPKTKQQNLQLSLSVRFNEGLMTFWWLKNEIFLVLLFLCVWFCLILIS